MVDRRNFLKGAILAASGIAVGIPTKALASGDAFTGVVYTGNNSGKWKGKEGSHAPKVTVNGKKVTVETNHSMTEQHYIVRHTLVSSDGDFIGGKTFYPNEKKAVSTYELPPGKGATYHATSFCNKHDLWLTKFSI